jgi:16S rRNA (cytosine1402-N4)-methyltransferase
LDIHASHEPVMVAEVLEHLEPSRGGLFVDCTVGLGGHTRALLEGGASRLIGLDRDPAAVAAARSALNGFGNRVDVVHADYRRLNAVLDERGVTKVDGVLVDLGVSSMQLDAPGRGFSFRQDAPLDMRMDTTAGPTAAEAIREVDERTLADVIYEFGEERHSRRVARAIVAARVQAPIETTGRLADIVRRAIPRKGYSRIDPATRTFQAIRIEVNGELDVLPDALDQAVEATRPGGRIAVLAYHSGEDRIVKERFAVAAGACECPPDLPCVCGAVQTVRIVRGIPKRPSAAEREGNRRAASARLRVVEKIEPIANADRTDR